MRSKKEIQNKLNSITKEIDEIYKNHSTIEIVTNFNYTLTKLENQKGSLEWVLKQ